ncbi:MAG: hypothetical protein RLZZ519_2537 [Bacteroidota bacterium]
MAIPLGTSCVNTRILASLSEQIGKVASMAAIEGMIPGAEQLPSELPGDGKQGQFDLVSRGPDGTIYIVEAFATNRLGNDPLIGLFWEGFDANRVKIRGLYAGTAPNVQITTFWPE